MLSDVARSRVSDPNVRATALLIVLCLATAWGAVALAGTKTGVVLALICALGPVAVYGAITAPMLFPFALFLVLVPFDNLLSLPSFGTLTKLIGLMCAAAFAVRLMRSRRYVVPDRAVLAWIPFLLLAVSSLAWAIDPSKGVSNILTLTEFVGLYVLVSFMPMDRRTLAMIVTAIIIGGALAGAYGGYLFHAGNDVSHGRLFVNDGTSAIDPNHFGAALVVPLILALTVFVESTKLKIRAFALSMAVLIALGVFISGSRGALLACAISIGYMVLRSRKRLVLGGLVLAGAGVGLAAFGNIINRFNQIAATGGAGRLGIWKVSFVAFERHPFLGSGFGNFPLAYNDAFLSVPAFASMKIVEGAHWTIAPHNNVVWVAVELGALGVIALLYAWWMQFRAVRIIPPTSDLYPLRVAAEAALIGQFVQGLTIGTLTYKYLWLAFMLAMIVRNAGLVQGGQKERENVVSPVLQTATRRG